jgi:hypothetical protein
VASAVDETDGDLSARVTVQQDLDTCGGGTCGGQQCQLATLQAGGCPPGVYRWVYHAADDAGNAARAVLTVLQRSKCCES